MRSGTLPPTLGVLTLAMVVVSCGADSGPSERGVRSFIDTYEYFDDFADELAEVDQALGEECLGVMVALVPLSVASESPFLGDQVELFFPDLDDALRDLPGLAPGEVRGAMETLASKSREAVEASLREGGFEAAAILDTPEYDEARRQVGDWLEANCEGADLG